MTKRKLQIKCCCKKFMYVSGINVLDLKFFMISHLISMQLLGRNLLFMRVISHHCCTVSVLLCHFSAVQ